MVDSWFFFYGDNDFGTASEFYGLSEIKLAIKRGCTVYCSDLSVRKVIGFCKKRLWESNPLKLVLGDLAWKAVPLLSEPVEDYTIEDLKINLRKTIVDNAHAYQINKAEYLQFLTNASTFEEVFNLAHDPKNVLAKLSKTTRKFKAPPSSFFGV